MFPKIGGFSPKMDGLFHGKPYEQMDDLEGFLPIFENWGHVSFFCYLSLPADRGLINSWPCRNHCRRH